MRRSLMVAAIVAAGVLLSATTASASSVHLKGGKNAEPTFTDGGLTLRATGELSGLGNGDVLVTLTATADVTATCSNPGKPNEAPGQNPRSEERRVGKESRSGW